MSRILILGADGQLGREFQTLLCAQKQDHFIFSNRHTLDITDFEKFNRYVGSNNVGVIINCAAYTNVEKAEIERKKAYLINVDVVRNISKLALKENIKFVHISTDYVFDGTQNIPYKENDETSPCGVYGQSKLDGEKEVLNISPKDSLIIRTSWLYGRYGQNFVKTILKNGREHGRLRVVFDQIGTPTYARDLAQCILSILPKLKCASPEIIHYSNEGVLSWYDFARAIVDVAGISCKVVPVETKEYASPVCRPTYSVLNKNKVKNMYNVEIPYWRDSLQLCMKNIEIEK